ncbi:hypothetical protein ASPBRDRAFT_129195 [Aspergillus brasiliensis CBS 101740]|uniref:Uncharacterized protein n=1 Tax=Aspergillus brasiliensis (strain CBS 101740 / IMI 381727 / IBT 21946) TaxID=767769 RepID=A0A1L9UGG6_ASPBC|nr:hypothetical protein ASPBRDRAFT_129195 [Aspergillus brasiliensis CBS 101740]
MALRLRDGRARPRMGKSGLTAQIGMGSLKRNYGTGPVESAAARRGPIKAPNPGEEKSRRGDSALLPRLPAGIGYIRHGIGRAVEDDRGEVTEMAP